MATKKFKDYTGHDNALHRVAAAKQALCDAYQQRQGRKISAVEFLAAKARVKEATRDFDAIRGKK